MTHTVGTQYLSHGKYPNLCTISDILTTYNSKGELVSTRYEATHVFLGAIVSETNIVAPTVAKGVYRLAEQESRTE